jgi:hypothetical protein
MVLLQYFSSLGAIFPILFGLLFFNRLSDEFAKPFLIYLITVTILETFCLHLSLNYINNHFVYNCIDLITIFFFVYINLKSSNKLDMVLTISIFAIAFYNAIEFNFNSYNQYNYLIIYFYIGLYSTIQLFKATKIEEGITFNLFRFWFYTGFMVPTFSSLTIYVFFENIINLDKTNILVQYYYFFTFVISFIQYLSFSIAFLCKK